MEREKLGSRLGFILISAGCAIGLGTVWRFPYITAKYGGGAFVLMYLIFLVMVLNKQNAAKVSGIRSVRINFLSVTVTTIFWLMMIK